MSAGDSSLTIGAILQDRFRLVSTLGEGGYARIFKATQLSTGQPVAIKVLLSDPTVERARDTARFEREMQIIARLRHPHIVKLIDSGVIGGLHPYLALEFNPGEPLNEVLRRRGPPPSPEALRLMRQVLEALAYAHREGVIHRDLKPHNIMVTDPGPLCNATVLDFGVAHLAEAVREPDFDKLTPTGEIAGTPTYMSPEQLLSRRIGPPADLYAWGLLLIECLTGQQAIAETSIVKLALRYGSGRGAAIPNALRQSSVGPLLERVTTIDPDERYQTAEAVLEDLQEVNPSDLPTVRAPALGSTAPAEPGPTFEGPPPALGSSLMLDPVPASPRVDRSDERITERRSTPVVVAGRRRAWILVGSGLLLGLLGALIAWALWP